MKTSTASIVVLLGVLVSACIITNSPEKAPGTINLVPNKLNLAVTGDHRSMQNKARDQYRNPEQTLTFFGFRPDMTVVELTPSGGWYTEILAPALKGSGKLYAAHYPDTGKNDYYSRSRRQLEQKLAQNPVYSEVELRDFTPKVASELAPANSADLVLTFRNLHNWQEAGVLQMFKDAYRALKPDGILGVVEHRLGDQQNWQQFQQSGYFPESLTISLAEQAGFELVGKSDINANSKDLKNHPQGVWTLPPTLRLGEQDKQKYLSIGESDRMTLKFKKLKK